MAGDPYAHIAKKNGYLRATFRLLRTDEGGRQSPIGGDYRPDWSIGVPDATKLGGAPLVTENGEGVALDGHADVRLFPIWPPFWKDVVVGTELFAFEGHRLVGTARVTEVIGPANE